MDRGGFGEDLHYGFRRQRVLAWKVVVEAAMCETRCLHEIGDADAIEAVLAELGAGDLHHVGAVLRSLLAGDFHRSTLLMATVM